MQHPNPDLIALGIQQPWAELVLRGLKTLEIRNVATRHRGAIYLYASKRISRLPSAQRAIERYQLTEDQLPVGRVVGTVEILACWPTRQEDAEPACLSEPLNEKTYSWLLGNAQRCPEPLITPYVPFGTWFYPFRRRGASSRRRRGNGKRGTN